MLWYHKPTYLDTLNFILFDREKHQNFSLKSQVSVLVINEELLTAETEIFSGWCKNVSQVGVDILIFFCSDWHIYSISVDN